MPAVKKKPAIIRYAGIADPFMPLYMWRTKIDELITEFGEDSLMYTEHSLHTDEDIALFIEVFE